MSLFNLPSISTSTLLNSPKPSGFFGGPAPSLGDPALQQELSNTASQKLLNVPGTFGASANNAPFSQSGSLFGKTLQQHQQQQQQQQQQVTNSMFGGLGTSPFAGLSGTTQQQSQQQPLQQFLQQSLQQPQQQQLQQLQQPQPQPQQQQQQQFGQSQVNYQASRLWPQTESPLGTKSVPEQMQLASSKWNFNSPSTLFQTYLYNAVSPDQVPFYRPGPQDDESKWEEALRNKPTPGSVPVMTRGFVGLGQRLLLQTQHLDILQGRLHEINNGLTTLLHKHDLEISVRAAECKRKHLRLSYQCLKLAAKVQVFKNRGYAMDSVEEELREKLLKLERSVSDPALNGRAEEIWARMVSVRERARLLQREFERAGQVVGDEVGGAMDEEVMKRARKILEDYSSQLAHLTKELHQIQKDLAEWEGSTAK